MFCHQTIILKLSHVVTIIHFAIQDGYTALRTASFNGHHKVVELLLVAGANPDLQDKVRTQQDSCVQSNLSNVNGTQESLVNLLFICVLPDSTLSIPHKYWHLSSTKPLHNCSACFIMRASTNV